MQVTCDTAASVWHILVDEDLFVHIAIDDPFDTLKDTKPGIVEGSSYHNLPATMFHGWDQTVIIELLALTAAYVSLRAFVRPEDFFPVLNSPINMGSGPCKSIYFICFSK